MIAKQLEEEKALWGPEGKPVKEEKPVVIEVPLKPPNVNKVKIGSLMGKTEDQ